MKVQGQASAGGLAERGEALHTLGISKPSSHWGGAFTWEGASLCPASPTCTRCLQPVLTHVQTLWELMLLGEPLVVLAPSPTVSSEMVLALTR